MLAEVLGQRGLVLVPDGGVLCPLGLGEAGAAVTMQLSFLLGL